MKKPWLWAGAPLKASTYLTMARIARKSNPEHYRDVKILIHELRLCNNWVRHFQKLFVEQSARLYVATRELCRRV